MLELKVLISVVFALKVLLSVVLALKMLVPRRLVSELLVPKILVLGPGVLTLEMISSKILASGNTSGVSAVKRLGIQDLEIHLQSF